MNRTKQISVNLMVTVGTFFLGACAPQESAPKQWQWQQCVDENGKIVPDELCDNKSNASGGYMPYHWWFFYGGQPLRQGMNVSSFPSNYANSAPFQGAVAQRSSAFNTSHPGHPSYATTKRGCFGGNGSSRSAIG